MSGYTFKKKCIFCLKIFFTLTNSVDPDEMPPCGVSSESSLFVKVSVSGFFVYKGLLGDNCIQTFYFGW